MAQRRMMSPKVIDTDDFMDMPVSAQNLYFHMLIRADDDGFLANPKRILRLVGAADDDYKILAAKRYVIPFDSGICVIRHWRVHNLIRSDRYNETMYREEREQLSVDNNGAYEDGNQMTTKRQPDDNQRLPEVSIGEVSKGESRDSPSGATKESKPLSPMKDTVANDYQTLLTEHVPSNAWSSFPKERKQLNKLADNTRRLATVTESVTETELPQAIVTEYLRMRRDNPKSNYWANAPVTPSGLVARWDSVVASLAEQEHKRREDAEALQRHREFMGYDAR